MNIIEFYKINNYQIPFKVRRVYHSATFAQITKVIITKYPYGEAFGIVYTRGVPPKSMKPKKITNAGCADWDYSNAEPLSERVLAQKVLWEKINGR